jgi:hypothetical protein
LGRTLPHERLIFDGVRFLIALLGPERVGEQPAGLSLRGAIAARECQRLAAATLGLMGIALGEAQPPQLDPHQRIVRFDAQRAIECGRGAVEVAMG